MIYIPVQGRLTDASGNPLDGTYDVEFRIYDVSYAGTAICGDLNNSVDVHNGLFTAYIYIAGCDAFDGRQLYLGITVSGDVEMTPRQYIDNVPYAMSLRPGAVISATIGNDALLHIENWAGTGRALRAYAMSETGVNYGIVGATRSPDGYGGYFYNNAGGSALYGAANSAAGGVGVRGESEVGSGVYGESSSGYGVYGLSTSNNAVYGDTQRVDHNYGFYTADNLYSLNYHTSGAIMQVVQNGSSESLEIGDVVIFTGVIPPTDVNGPPTILVSKASSANSTAVAGVVYSRYAPDGVNLEGAAKPGESLLIVVHGPAQVKASAAASAIQVGDLLSSSDQAGVASCSAKISIGGIQTSLPGTVFAKALEALNSGEGWIYVFVTLQ